MRVSGCERCKRYAERLVDMNGYNASKESVLIPVHHFRDFRRKVADLIP